uniref:G_PROTEIN_RECEP_F1_2 domain-containing protein n=1 Tax=Heterorhabditis bacteriophora TaxID=37862 RepID=A0A1I7WNU3_HETBA
MIRRRRRRKGIALLLKIAIKVSTEQLPKREQPRFLVDSPSLGIRYILCTSYGTIHIATFEDSSVEQCYPLVNVYSRNVLVAFNFFHVVTTFYVPLLIVIVCYTLIGISLRKQMAERRLLQDGGKQQKQSSTKARFLRASLAIICTFFFTWLPYQVCSMLS